METQITIKLSEEEKKLFEEAGKLLGIGHSTFCRVAALEKARELIKANM